MKIEVEIPDVIFAGMVEAYSQLSGLNMPQSEKIIVDKTQILAEQVSNKVVKRLSLELSTRRDHLEALLSNKREQADKTFNLFLNQDESE